ncbi:hypothetical protein EZI54_10490 [Marinobacter halodurans]|uniref:Dystroglycan-type cadherin-like domain-containing protein n=1 Tax=Marinobacter halodurans TaxID=2528979 RepID=A0ABY1ZKR5_9GAMM|nr:putative Ig domain-containing protein [Marinobacter halodurans]TBW56060.1 hypothetical protein EZI54_10490 [Marinobacter halodurans]
MKWMLKLSGWVLTGMVLLSAHAAAAEESLCAVVKIQIAQELTLERQAFEATMRITNSLDSMALENVKVNIQFEDSDGNSVLASSDSSNESAAFFIDLDASQHIASVTQGDNGAITDGQIDPAEVAELRWLIVPTVGAGGEGSEGQLYYVGATLSFTYGGESQTIEVAPDTIVVKPQPNLTLDYFLPNEVNGDNPFTDEVEPVEPYNLGVRVANTGSGTAHAVKIQSAQPKIIENEHNLLVDFLITGSFVDDAPAQKTLLTDFGDIPSHSNTTGRWIMETSLTGKFTDFDARFTHADEYGGELTSLVDAVNTHFLLHDVRVDLPGRDHVRDFLALDGATTLLYESEHTGLDLLNCTDCLAVTRIDGSLGGGSDSGNGINRTLTVTPPGGAVHIKLADPYQGDQVLSAVTRADGSALDPANYWLSKTLQDDKIHFDHYLNLFDTAAAESYTLTFGGQAQVNAPPVLQYIANYTTYETGQVGFLVQASDPDGAVPALSATGLPAGASFQDKGNGEGVFSWFPAVGQAGSYTLQFMASDGELTASRAAEVVVFPNDDTDGDGMNDDWEREHFGDLSHDGTEDTDGDGVTDLEEFNRDSDPTVKEAAPAAPQLDIPAYGAEVTSLTPTLRVVNGDNSARGNVTYTFELYSNESLTQPVAEIGSVAEGVDTTEVVLDSSTLGGATLQDNQRYYWRVNARTASGASEWVDGRFFVNTQNDAPAAFTLSKPANQTLVDTETPTLVVNNSADIDEDAITYTFEVYDETDTTFSNPVARVAGLAQGGQGQTQWTVSTPLLNGQLYYWIAIATDEHGATTVGEPASFIVSTSNLAPPAPALVAPAVNAVIPDTATDLTVENSQDPERQGVTYAFQLDTVNTFDSAALQTSGTVEEGTTTTSWSVSGLVKGQTYYWRAKASDGSAESAWTTGQFQVKSDNRPPETPTLANPADTAWVEVLTPTLSVHPVTDPDGDTVTYTFELYSDAGLSDRIQQVNSATTEWTVPAAVANHQTYYWRARTVDAKGAGSAWSGEHRFFTNKDGIDDAPTFSFVTPSESIAVYGGSIPVQWVDQDPDSNASIRLYANDTLIADGIEEDPDGEADRFDWNLSLMPVGDYVLKAVIDDGTTPVTVENCCIVRKLAPEVAVTVTADGDAITNEQGTQDATFQVALDHAPEQGTTVLLNLSVSDSGEGILLNDPAYLEFTPDNWSTPQTVRVAGVDDCDVDGDSPYYLQIAPAVSDDIRFNGIVTPDAPITNRDNEPTDQSLFLCGFALQGQTDLGGGTSQYRYQVQLRNLGLGVNSATATATNLTDSGLTPTSGYPIAFGTVNGGESVWSAADLIVEADTAITPHPEALAWAIEASAPTVTSEPDYTAVEGQAYTYQIQASGREGDTFTYRLVDGPEGVTVDPQTGLVQWTPGADQQGTLAIVVEVVDQGGGVARQTIRVNVAPEDQPNAHVVIVDTNPDSGADYNSLAAAIAGESRDLTQPLIIRARATSGLADTAPVDIVAINPTAENRLTIIFEDGYLLDASVQKYGYAINLRESNVTLRGEGGRIRVSNSGNDFVDAIQVSGQAAGSIIRLESLRIEGDITGSPKSGAGLRLSDENATYIVRNNLVTGFGGSYQNAGVYVSGTAFIDNNTFVGNRYGLRIETSEATVRNNLSVDNSAVDYGSWGYTWTVTGNNISSDDTSPDPDFRSRTVEFVDADAGNYQLAPWDEAAVSQGVNLSSAGSYPFHVDALGNDRGNDWSVGAFSVGAVSNWPPFIDSLPVTQVDEEADYNYIVQASDHDNDILTYSLVQKPNGMSIDPGLGEITWTPTSDQVGEFPVELQVTDGKGGLAKQTFVIVVSPSGSGGARLVTVDTNPEADVDYHSLWEAMMGEPSAHDHPLLIRVRATSGVVDHEPVTIFHTLSTKEFPLTIVLEKGYRLDVSGVGDYPRALFIRAPFVHIKGEGGEIVIRNKGYNYAYGVDIDRQVSGSVITIDNLIIKGEMTLEPSSSTGISASDPNATYVLRNNIISGFTGSYTNHGIYIAGPAFVFNNTLIGNGYGLRVENRNTTVLNNLAIGNQFKDLTSWQDFWNVTGNNVSADGSSPDEDFRSRTVQFVDAPNGDYRLAPEDTAAQGQGVDLSAYPDFGFDFYATGEARVGNWDIGALPVSE